LIKYAGVNEARFDHDPETGESLGLLIEEARTNSISNNTMVGAVAGAPGTLPTNWTGSSSPSNGISREIIGTGTENGINYIDIRFSGTTTASLFFTVRFTPPNQIAATNGQTWTSTLYVRLIGGSFANISGVNHVISYNNADGAAITFGSGFITPTNATLNTQRFTRTATASNASTAFIQSYIQIQSNSGVSIDFTLRIGLPQLEQGAFATSVIPTQASTRTRAADNASITGKNFSDWYRQDEGTFYADAFYKDKVTNTRLFFTENTSIGFNSRHGIVGGTTSGGVGPYGETFINAVPQAFLNYGAATKNTNYKAIYAYKENDFGFTINGLPVLTDNNGKLNLNQNIAYIGGRITANSLSSTIKSIKYFPKRLPNSQLISLTT
jgi:hypothetical protein